MIPLSLMASRTLYEKSEVNELDGRAEKKHTVQLNMIFKHLAISFSRDMSEWNLDGVLVKVCWI
jgi:hypothetical protein